MELVSVTFRFCFYVLKGESKKAVKYTQQREFNYGHCLSQYETFFSTSSYFSSYGPESRILMVPNVNKDVSNDIPTCIYK